MPKICIDPGHGGSDPGAVANGLQEKDLTLDVGLKLRDILLKDGRFQVKMTRETDVSVSLSDRAKISNDFGADLFVSPHFNAFNGKAYGTEVLDYNGTGIGRVVGQTFVDILEAEEGLYDRGVKATHSTFAVIRETKCPAIITESCFIDTASDIQHFDTLEEREKLARYHYRAICAGFGMEPKQEATKPKICYYVTGGFGEGGIASQEFETFMQSKGWYYDKKY